MKKSNDCLKLARVALRRGRTSTIIGKSQPMSQAADAALGQLDILIKSLDSAASVPNVHKALRDIMEVLEPYHQKNDEVNAAYQDLAEAEELVKNSSHDDAREK